MMNDKEILGAQGATAVEAAGQAVPADQLSHVAREVEQAIVDRTLARVLKAFDEWRVTLASDRGFNHHEGMAFIRSIAAIGWLDFCSPEPSAPAAEPVPVVDLMGALRAALERVGSDTPKPFPSPPSEEK